MLSQIIASLAFLAAPQHVPSHLTLTPCEFPESYQFAAAECSVELRNDGDKPINISKTSAFIEGDTMTPAALVVPPHSVAYAQARVLVGDGVGKVRRSFHLDTDEPGQAHRSVEANGFVTTILDDAKPTLDFGVVNLGDQMPEKTATLGSREVHDLRIVEVLSAPDYLSVEIGKDGASVRAQVKKDAPWGLHEADFVKLRVNAPQQSQVWIAVKIDVHGDVIPDSNPYALGLMRQGNSNEFLIRLSSRSHTDFRTGAVKVERIKGDADVRPCEPVAKGCKLLHFRVDEDQPTGSAGGLVTVDLPDYKRTLPVYVWGMLVGAKTEVKDFGKAMQEAADKQARSGVAAESRGIAGGNGIDLKQVIKQNVAGAAAESSPPPGKGPLLKWSVAHQELVYGYLVYRADTQAGPFYRVNKETIRSTSTDATGSLYQWRDNSAESEKTYWYYVGILNKDGSKQQLSGPQKVVAK